MSRLHFLFALAWATDFLLRPLLPLLPTTLLQIMAKIPTILILLHPQKLNPHHNPIHYESS